MSTNLNELATAIPKATELRGTTSATVSDAETKNNNESSSINSRDCAVLCIETQYRQYDSAEPYMTPKICDSVGSGFILKTALPGNDEERLFFVTNAHVVAEANSIRVRYSNTSKTYPAKTLFINHECDLALLSIDDSSFWKQRKPFVLRDGFNADDIQASVFIIGFPAGGTECSITQGIISRIELLAYSHSGVNLPAIQVDASINPGNSGGPAILKDKVVGVSAFKRPELENMNSIIPVTVLKNFLRQSVLKDIHSVGFPYPDFLLHAQTLENKFLRRSLMLQDNETGILITQDSVACNLRKNDILTHIDDIPIDNTGKIIYRGILLPFSVIRSEKLAGEKWKLTFIRNRTVQTIECYPNQTWQENFRSIMGYAAKIPSFYVGSGIVFQAITVNDEWRPGLKPRTAEQEEPIRTAKILKDDITDGYEQYNHKIVTNVNGVFPKNMRHLIELFEKNPESLHTIQVYNLYPKDVYTIVLPNLEKDPASKKDFLSRCGVFIDRSNNLLPEPKNTLLQFSNYKQSKDDEKNNASMPTPLSTENNGSLNKLTSS